MFAKWQKVLLKNTCCIPHQGQVWSFDEQSKPMWSLNITLSISDLSGWQTLYTHRWQFWYCHWKSSVKGYEESSTRKLGLWILTCSGFAKKKPNKPNTHFHCIGNVISKGNYDSQNFELQVVELLLKTTTCQETGGWANIRKVVLTCCMMRFYQGLLS